MSPEPGLRLEDFLRSLNGARYDAPRSDGPQSDANVTRSIWKLSGATWDVEVIVDPSHWLGLTFDAVDPPTGRKIHYAIDTDLYDLSRPDQRPFATEIETDIIEFLGHLTHGRVLRGQHRSDVLIVFPLGGAFIRLTQGRFMTRLSRHPRQADALGDVGYAPFT